MFIKSIGNVSPQLSFSQLLKEPAIYTTNRLSCIEPDYASIIDQKLIRRMSRIIKMGVAAAMKCLDEAGNVNPSAIITGTAYGCLADTELFLNKMVEHKEELLAPTAFIQSTHNTVGAQIALMLKCHNYNNTFVHRGFSFENALLDAITLMNGNDITNVLVGAVDETTNTSHAILSRLGLYKKGKILNNQIFDSNSRGTISGEGAVFFLLSNTLSKDEYAWLKGLHTFYKPSGIVEIEENINSFLLSQSVAIADIDIVIVGKNGDNRNDKIYDVLMKELLNGRQFVYYKNLCGEYPTSSAFALWLAANIIKSGKVPAIPSAKKPQLVLIYNNYLGIHHSLYLLSAC